MTAVDSLGDTRQRRRHITFHDRPGCNCCSRATGRRAESDPHQVALRVSRLAIRCWSAPAPTTNRFSATSRRVRGGRATVASPPILVKPFGCARTADLRASRDLSAGHAGYRFRYIEFDGIDLDGKSGRPGHAVQTVHLECSSSGTGAAHVRFKNLE